MTLAPTDHEAPVRPATFLPEMETLPVVNGVDIAAAAVLAFGAARGAFRGLSGELAQFISIATGFAAGLWATPYSGKWISQHTRLSERGGAALAFLLIVMAALAIALVLRWLLAHLLKPVPKSPGNRLGGLVFGLLRSTVLILLVFFVMNIWPDPYLNRQFGKNSLIGRGMLKYVPGLADEEDRVPQANGRKTGRRET